MSNRDPSVFTNPNEIDLGRTGNRHHSFGLGIHRCIGSNMARMIFKRMLIAVLDRMPDFTCDPDTTVHYETIGVIQGMRHLPATFTPGRRLGDGLAETIARMQAICDEQRLADPVTIRKAAARITGELRDRAGSVVNGRLTARPSRRYKVHASRMSHGP
jgi:hypothetical protein